MALDRQTHRYTVLLSSSFQFVPLDCPQTLLTVFTAHCCLERLFSLLHPSLPLDFLPLSKSSRSASGFYCLLGCVCVSVLGLKCLGVFAFMVKPASESTMTIAPGFPRRLVNMDTYSWASTIEQCLSGSTEHFLLRQVQVPSAFPILVGFRLFKHSH